MSRKEANEIKRFDQLIKRQRAEHAALAPRSYLPVEKPFSRREFLKNVAMGAKALAVLATLGGSAAGAIEAKRVLSRPNGDQEKAARYLATAPEKDIVGNLHVSSDGVELRDRPSTAYGKLDGIDEGGRKGKLEPGTLISRAIKVVGNDANGPYTDPDNPGTWFAFERPDGEVVFAFSGYVFGGSTSAQRFDLRKELPSWAQQP